MFLKNFKLKFNFDNLQQLGQTVGLKETDKASSAVWLQLWNLCHQLFSQQLDVKNKDTMQKQHWNKNTLTVNCPSLRKPTESWYNPEVPIVTLSTPRQLFSSLLKTVWTYSWVASLWGPKSVSMASLIYPTVADLLTSWYLSAASGLTCCKQPERTTWQPPSQLVSSSKLKKCILLRLWTWSTQTLHVQRPLGWRKNLSEGDF